MNDKLIERMAAAIWDAYRTSCVNPMTDVDWPELCRMANVPGSCMTGARDTARAEARAAYAALTPLDHAEALRALGWRVDKPSDDLPTPRAGERWHPRRGEGLSRYVVWRATGEVSWSDDVAFERISALDDFLSWARHTGARPMPAWRLP